MLFGGQSPDFGVAPGAQPTGQLAADVQLDVGVTHQQRLSVGVDGDELNTF